VRGFREAIDQFNAGRARGRLEIVAELPGGGVKDQALRAADDLLQAHPDLAGVFAINDPSALGARAALEKAGKTQVKLVGFDGQPEGKQAIKDGRIYADPVQFPERIGQETARAIVKHFAGEAVPAQILIPTALYRQSDALQDPGLK
jgi:ribose transport system substrate-binding protein